MPLLVNPSHNSKLTLLGGALVAQREDRNTIFIGENEKVCSAGEATYYIIS
jgi:hypothetical protein